MDQDRSPSEERRYESEAECPICHVPQLLTLRAALTFPDDADGIVDLLLGETNRHRCETCGVETHHAAPLLLAGADGTHVVAAPTPELTALLESQGADQSTWTTVEDYDALRRTALAWCDDYMMRATRPLVSDDTEPEPERDAHGVALAETPLVLRLMHEQVEGRIPARVGTEPPQSAEWQQRFLAELYVAHLVGLLGDLYRDAFHGPGIAAYPALVEARIPAACLTAPVLTTLIERCAEWDEQSLTDGADLGGPLRHELKNAAAHAVAGVENPRAGTWASVAFLLFLLERSGQTAGPVSLDGDALRRTISYEQAWNAAGPLVWDPERGESAVAWLHHCGWESRLGEHMASVPLHFEITGDGPADDDEALTRRVLAKLDGDFATVEAGTIAGMARALVRSMRPGAAIAVMETMRARLHAAGRWEDLASLTIRSAELLRDLGEHRAASDAVFEHWEALNGEDILPVDLRLGLINEAGNALRYARALDRALEAYDLLLALADETEVEAHHRVTYERNRGIVLRDLGRFSEAVEVLDRLERETRDERTARRVGILTSYALAYLSAGLPREALTLSEQAVAIRLADTEGENAVPALLAHAKALSHLDPAAATPVWEAAFAAAQDSPSRSVTTALAVLDTAAVVALPEVLIARAEPLAAAQAGRFDPGHEVEAVGAAVVVATARLERGDPAGAAAILAPVLEDDPPPADLPWQINHLLARMSTSTAERYEAMRHVLTDLDATVPDQSGLAFATPWIGGKTAVQEDMAAAFHDAVAERVADPRELMALADFLYARDIPAQASGVALPDDVVEITFFEHGDQVTLQAHGAGAGTSRTAALGTGLGEIRRAVEAFGRAIGIGCVSDRQARRAEERIAPLLAELGAAIAAHAPVGCHVCLVPSPALIGLPLHAATVDGAPLIADRTISVAPSPRVLRRALASAASRPAGPPGGTLAVVPKNGELPAIQDLLGAAATRIATALDLELLSGVDVTKQACLDAFAGEDLFVFLGHGAEGPALHGRGLCLAAGGRLPGALLPVDVTPALRRYLLDAADLERTTAAPAMLISLACSSGRARPGPGGTRIGLERSLFANGTRTIVAPLWDVDFEAAATFVTAFAEAWHAAPGARLAEHHRTATLAVRADRPLLYHWAPFTLNGSFI